MLKLSYKGYEIVIFIDEISTEIDIDQLGAHFEFEAMDRRRASDLAKHFIEWSLANPQLELVKEPAQEVA